MTEIVGLRFVVQGEDQVIRALREYQKTKENLTRALEQTLNAFDKGERRLQRFAKELDIGRLPAGTYNKVLDEMARKLSKLSGISAAKAREEIERFNKALKAEQAEQAKQAYDKFVASFDRTYRAALKLAQAQEIVKRAVEAGVVSAGEGAAVLEQYAARLESTASSAELLRKQQQRIAEAYNKLAGAVDEGVRKAQEFARAQETVRKAVEAGIITEEEGAETLRKLKEKLDGTARSAEALAREKERLARAFNPVLVAQLTFERRQADLKRALELGILTMDQYEAKLNEMRMAFSQIGGDALKAKHFVNQFGDVVHLAGQKTNKYGLVIQQVGYQVSDFFVQVQSGTNVFVAFGQQATQLLGLIPGVIGAVSGISVSIATMILAFWSRSRAATEQAKKLEEAYNGVGSALRRIESADITSPAREFLFIAQQTRKEFENILGLIERAGTRDLQRGLQDAVKPFESALEAWDRSIQRAIERWVNRSGLVPGLGALGSVDAETRAAVLAGVSRVRAAVEAIPPEGVDTLGLESYRQLLAVVSSLKRIQGETREELQRTFVVELKRLEAMRLLTPEVETLLAKLAEELGFTETINELLRQRTDLYRQEQEAIQKRVDALKEPLSKLIDETNTRSRLLELVQSGLTFSEAETQLARERELAELKVLAAKGRSIALDAALTAQERAMGAAIERRAQLAIEQLEAAERLKQLEQDRLKLIEWQNETTKLLEQQLAALVAQNAERSRLLQLLAEGNTLERARAIYAEEARQAELDRIEAMAQAVLESANATDEMRAIARATLEATAAARGLSMVFSDVAAQVYEIPEALRQALALISAMQGRLRSEMFESVERGATLAALRAGASIEDARLRGEIARIRAESAERIGLLLKGGEGMNSPLVRLERQQTEQLIQNAIRASQENAEISALIAAQRGGGGGGGGGTVQTLADIVAGLEEQIVREQELLRLSERQRIERELYYQIVDQLRRQGVVYSDEAVRQAAAILAAQKQITEEIRRQQQMTEWLANSFTDLWMGALQGADAFRQALANILRQLAQMLANAAFKSILTGTGFGQGLAGALSVLVTPSAKGNVFLGGNVVPFATGGVIGSPILFPMQGGRVGLMGEAGPEAIMPLRRGRDGRLGVAAQSAVALDVRVSVDDDGRLQAYVRNVSRDTLREATPAIVRTSVAATYRANSERRMR